MVRQFWPIVIGCLLVQAVLAADCAQQWTPTHDEYWHLPIGLRMWNTGRLDDDVINPPPVRLWAALPLAICGVSPGSTEPGLDVGQIGDAFWAAHGEKARTWFLLGRLMIIPFALLTGLVIATWGRAWYGHGPALLGVLLWTCCPTGLANTSIVTHDLPLAAAWVITLFFLVRFADQPKWGRALAFGIALGAALLTKLTALILVPLCVVLWLILRTGRSHPAPVKSVAAGAGTDAAASERSRRILTSWVIAMVTALFVINACYVFRGTGTSLGAYVFTSERMQQLQKSLSAIGWLPIPLPADYVAAINRLAQDLGSKHPIYLDGEWADQAFACYYAAALIYKLPLSTLLLFVVALGVIAWPRPGSSDRRHALFLLMSAFTLPVLASGSPNQIGIRYILPTLPLMCLFAGQSARWLAGLRSRTILSRVGSLGVLMLVIAAPLSLRFHPHHLAYFNVIAGGPREGGWHLVDSNIDWGQDLFALRDYLRQHQINDVGLAYFGTVYAASIGIESHEPPRGFPQPGWYAISVSFVHGRPHVLRNSQGGRVQVGLGEFSYFRFFKPVATIGYSINVYQLTPHDVSRYAFELQPR